jgi:Mn-dependent DtxR family transcriptional regulator
MAANVRLPLQAQPPSPLELINRLEKSGNLVFRGYELRERGTKFSCFVTYVRKVDKKMVSREVVEISSALR